MPSYIAGHEDAVTSGSVGSGKRVGGRTIPASEKDFNVSYQLQTCYYLGNILPIMSRTGPSLLPRISRLLRGYGENLRLARLRRRYSAESVAQRAGISRKTLSKVEKGDAAVALGIYARVMQVLRLEEDLAKLGVDDPLGRKLQDTGLSPKRRAPKRSISPTPTADNIDKPKETS